VFPGPACEGLNISLNDWSDLLYFEEKAISEEPLSLWERRRSDFLKNRPLDLTKIMC